MRSSFLGVLQQPFSGFQSFPSGWSGPPRTTGPRGEPQPSPNERQEEPFYLFEKFKLLQRCQNHNKTLNRETKLKTDKAPKILNKQYLWEYWYRRCEVKNDVLFYDIFLWKWQANLFRWCPVWVCIYRCRRLRYI